MPRSLPLFWMLMLALDAPGAQAAARVGTADVRLNPAGIPCFTILQAEERQYGTPEFRSISVSQARTGDRVLMWAMALPAARTFPLSFRMCVPYAGRLPVLPQTPALALVPGVVYEVSILVKKPRDSAAPLSYGARFCVRTDPVAQLELRQPGQTCSK